MKTTILGFIAALAVASASQAATVVASGTVTGGSVAFDALDLGPISTANRNYILDFLGAGPVSGTLQFQVTRTTVVSDRATDQVLSTTTSGYSQSNFVFTPRSFGTNAFRFQLPGGEAFNSGTEPGATHTETSYSLSGLDFLLSSPSSGDFSLVVLSTTTAPELETWAMLILGFGAAGAVLRSRRRGLPV